MKQILRWVASLVVVSTLFPAVAGAQYFGQNKPSYRTFRYQVKQMPHFEIYHYFEDETLLNYFANRSEEWYSMHQRMFADTFKQKNPLILYSTHAEFQQTTAISGSLGVGTGGVTESLKNRVVIPATHSIAQIDHVLGHELVHAFQFNRLLNSDSIKRNSLNNIPLWMIEGMAEYLSIGSVDPNTAMWMRDALLNRDFPGIKKLSADSHYFPYRYGHSLLAMIGKTWGDSLVVPLLIKTARLGLDKALDTIVGFDSKTLSDLWKITLECYYKPFMKDSSRVLTGKKIISETNSGSMNLSPSLSPNGKYIAYFSEKDVFSLDLFLADANSGKIIRKVTKIKRNQDIDDFSFIESGGTWSPDSRKYAFVVFSRGSNKIVVIDVRKGQIDTEISIEGVLSLTSPEWSPDGRFMVFNGLVNGIGNLYRYDLELKKTEKLTSNFYSSIHPAWSSDGKNIVFSSESVNGKHPSKRYCFNISMLNMETRETRTLNLFPGADNLNPRFSHDDKSIYFLSNADGFRNLYRYDLAGDQLFRLTQYVTGISGITPFSPAISTARDNDLIAYTYYFNNKYEIYTARGSEFTPVETNRDSLNFDAGTLPPLMHIKSDIVDAALYKRGKDYIIIPPDSIRDVPYKPRFRLDYISNNVNIGVSTGRTYSNNNMGGSVFMIFSDIVGNNQLYSSLALNGEIYDFGGQTAYINQTRRIKWGASVSHIPYRSGYMDLTMDSLTINDQKYLVTNLMLDYIRLFEDNISLFTFYPITQTRRLEAGASASWYYYRIDRYNYYYDLLGYPIGVKREKLPAPEGNNYQVLDMAYVQDNSTFGMTAPMTGSRSRIQIEKYFGVVNFYTGLIDYRKYYFTKPVGFALRVYHNGRYGADAENQTVYPYYLGYPWLIRGYEDISFYGDMASSPEEYYFNISNLMGSKIVVANFEVRLPFTGPENLALIKSKLFYTDLNLFFDSGLAWSNGDKVRLRWEPENFSERIPVFSAGASLRLNLFGALIIEPYYAFPFQNKDYTAGVFGVNFLPGW